MKFIKDILMIDFESVGSKTDFPQPTQIGAILLDKETLEEKDSFVSYISADLPQGYVGKKTGISQETLIGAPSQAEVGKMIFEKFGTDIFIGSWVANLDMTLFRKIMTSADIDSNKYDYHVVDVWPAAYVYLLKRGYEGSIRSEEVFQAFGMPPREKHDALNDCRLATEVLRKIMRG